MTNKVLERRGFLMQAGGFLLLTSGVFYGCSGGGGAPKPPLPTSTAWLTALRSQPVEGTLGERALVDVKHSTVQGRIWGTVDSSGLPTSFTQAIASTDGRTGFARVLLSADGMPSLISDASTGTAVTVVPDGNGIILRFFDTDGLHQGSIRFTTGTGDRVQAEVLPRTRALHISLPKIKMAQARLRSRAVTNWVGAASESLDESSSFDRLQLEMMRAVAEGLINVGTTAVALAGVIALLGGTITAASALAIAAPLVAGIVLGLLFSSGVKDLKSRQDSGGNLSVDFAEEPTPRANALPLDYKAPDSFLVPEKVDVTFEHPTPVPTPTAPNPGGPPSNPTAGQEWTNPKDGSVLIWVPGGTFQMGTNDTSDSWLQYSRPVHSVTLSGFWMGKYEVTVGQYRAYCTATGRSMPTAPSWGWIDSHPMVNVSWEDVVAYGTWSGLKLPTEAQWEYAASGGDGRKWPWGNTWDGSRCANSLSPNNLSSTKPVGSYPSGVSPFGMLDMAGNVWEWCGDWWADSYTSGAKTDPSGPSTGVYRVFRGGSWFISDADGFRCANRYRGTPDGRDGNSVFVCLPQDCAEFLGFNGAKRL